MEASFDIVTRIAERIDQLSLSEQKVARWILADLSVAGAASIDTLAQEAGVSKASVTRFAKALGCTDVRELKRRLTQAAAIGSRFLQPRPDDAPADSADVVYQDIVAMLQANRALVNMDVVKRAAQAVRKANMVYAFGMGGGSTVAADEARFRLVRFGIPVSTYQDAVLQRVVAATMDHRAVVLAFSVTGQVPEMLTSVRIAREYGAQIIAITALGSPLARLADHLLPIQIMETDFVFKPSSSRYAMLMMLDILATEVAMLEHTRAQELLRRIKYVLDTGRGGGDRQPLGD
ncbi:MurR/RpiR family transcriptional regulator [Silvimonas iriomotensis]|uniref:Transcriptional regulator n=1 Tax=Silvimonas iriomotensis TaxID=449662 RepID=A0ABQ2PE67_9NEIS|nr:MurR/RpiR family transcriptional regulator [Silvimonas iriomotensis]GGP23681.1 transcriptional regulator [Silvimonas iriomotensis]